MYNGPALELIKKAKEEKATYLDLGNCGLTDLNEIPELFECVDLEVLILSSEWFEYENHQRVYKQSQNSNYPNKVNNLSPQFKQLKKLNKLICRGYPDYKWKITDISFLSGLKNLTTLDLSLNQITNYSFLSDLKNLKTLDLSENQIIDISFLTGLKNLKTLDLNENQITDISFLSGLKNLITLNLSENQIIDISFLSDLKHLMTLNLGYTQTTDISFLSDLKNLMTLNLSYTQVTDFSLLSKLRQLTTLYLSLNQITDISFLSDLKQLTTLYLSSNQIRDISFLSELKQLTTLNLDYNQVTDISFLSELKQLTTLNLGYNQIRDISFLSELKNLKTLNLSQNQITDISFLSNLKHLTTLYLNVNQIVNISFLSDLKHLADLRIDNNPFEKVTNLILQPFNNQLPTIKNYLSRLIETNKIKVILPAKILLLGNHGSGKSSLLHYIQEDTLEEKIESTHIINIEKYPKDTDEVLPQAVFFDFGGQDYYHGIYRVFLSSGSIHLLLWHNKTNQNKERVDSNQLATRDFELSYWLGQKTYIENEKYGGENDPILLIQTHADDIESKKINHINLLNKQHIDNEFYIALTTQEGNKHNTNQKALEYLKSSIVELIENKQITREEPKWYINFLEFILSSENTTHKSKTIKEVLKHYKRKIEDNAVLIDFLKDDLDQLHKQGLVLYYKEQIPDSVWINPKALVNHIHRDILNKENLKDYKGVTPSAIFKDFDPNIVKMLEIQKVIFKHSYGNEGEEYIIPNFLPLTKDSRIDYDLFTFGLDNSAFILHFKEFLPFGLINQMICHFGRLPDKKKFWRDQLLFTIQDKVRVLIHLDFTALEIRVYTAFKSGNTEGDKTEVHKYLFYSILALYWDMTIFDFDEYLNFKSSKYDHIGFNLLDPIYQKISSFENLFTNSNCRPVDLFISLNNIHFINYKTLCDIGNAPVIQSYIKKDERLNHYKEIPVYPFQIFTNKTLNKMKKVFISYSHHDEYWKDELIKNLSPLRNQEMLLDWNDRKIEVGMWDSQIEKAMEESDIFLLLITHNFLASSYITSKEITNAYEQYKAGKSKIVPIICDSCAWELQPITKTEKEMHPTENREMFVWLGKFQSFPKDGKPIKNWSNPQDGFVDVINKLKKYL